MHTFTLPAAGRSRIIMLIMLSEMLCIILFDFKSDAIYCSVQIIRNLFCEKTYNL